MSIKAPAKDHNNYGWMHGVRTCSAAERLLTRNLQCIPIYSNMFLIILIKVGGANACRTSTT